MQGTADGNGYWLVQADGNVTAYGDAPNLGNASALGVNNIVGMAVTPDGAGYYLLGKDGGVFSYGDAQFYGSTGGQHLNAPALGMSVTPNGGG